MQSSDIRAARHNTTPRAQHLMLLAFSGALISLLFAAACVSPPRAVGPTTLTGSLPIASVGATAGAARAPGAIDGPLQIVDPHFAWLHAAPTAAAYTWRCTVDNPSQSTFEVTVVMQLLDINGRPLASSNQAFRLDGGRSMPVEGEGTVDGEVAGRVDSWRLEYWVKVPPRPPREAPSVS